MRLMLSGFHHWSPVSCMQVACNAMQFSRVSLFYTFSVIVNCVAYGMSHVWSPGCYSGTSLTSCNTTDNRHCSAAADVGSLGGLILQYYTLQLSHLQSVTPSQDRHQSGCSTVSSSCQGPWAPAWSAELG